MNEYIWVVESLVDDTPTLVSLHSDQAKAFAARDAYTKSYRYGGTADDYWVHGVKLNWTGLEGEE